MRPLHVANRVANKSISFQLDSCISCFSLSIQFELYKSVCVCIVWSPSNNTQIFFLFWSLFVNAIFYVQNKNWMRCEYFSLEGERKKQFWLESSIPANLYTIRTVEIDVLLNFNLILFFFFVHNWMRLAHGQWK